jgi:hypothetical protein
MMHELTNNEPRNAIYWILAGILFIIVVDPPKKDLLVIIPIFIFMIGYLLRKLLGTVRIRFDETHVYLSGLLKKTQIPFGYITVIKRIGSSVEAKSIHWGYYIKYLDDENNEHKSKFYVSSSYYKQWESFKSQAISFNPDIQIDE